MRKVWSPVGDTWEVNQDGIVRNRRTGWHLALRLRRDGYLDVKLNYKRYLVHRLVAVAFLPNPEKLPQVNHKDGQRNNPAVENLEWCDQFQNMRHALDTGLFPSRKGEKNGRATITKETAKAIKEQLADGVPMPQISKVFQVSYGVIANIKYGRTWTIL